jgi:replicative DNA helicase
MFIHRPEYYGIQTDQDGNSLKGVAEIIVAKHRNGAVGEFHLSFKAHLARFSDLESARDDSSISDLHEPRGRNGVYSSKMNTELHPVENERGKSDFGRPGSSFADDTPF